MTAISITPGYPNYSDTDGSALNDGYVYIGLEYQNPITSPRVAFWDKEFKIPADQPLRTSGGYIVRNGSPAAVYTGAAYSILVQNKNLVTVYNAPSAVITNVTNTVEDITQYQGAHATDPLSRNDGTPLQVGDLYFNTSVNELKVWTGSVWAATSPGSVTVQNFTGTGSQAAFNLSTAPIAENNTQIYIDGVYQQKDTYAVAGATINFSTAPPNLSTIEVVSFSIASLGTVDSSNVSYNQGGTGAVNQTVQSKLQESVSVKDFGAVGDGVTDDTVAVTAFLTSIISTGDTGLIPEGIYLVDTISLVAGSGFNLIGSGTIKATGSNRLNMLVFSGTVGTINIDGITIDGNNIVARPLDIQNLSSTASTLGSVYLGESLRIINAKNNTPSTYTASGIWVEGGFTEVIFSGEIDGVDSTLTSGASCGGLDVTWDAGAADDWVRHTIISSSAKIKNVKNSNSALADADGIRVFAPTTNHAFLTVNSGALFENCKGRSIKSQVVGNAINGPIIKRSLYDGLVEIDLQYAGGYVSGALVLHEGMRVDTVINASPKATPSNTHCLMEGNQLTVTGSPSSNTGAMTAFTIDNATTKIEGAIVTNNMVKGAVNYMTSCRVANVVDVNYLILEGNWAETIGTAYINMWLYGSNRAQLSLNATNNTCVDGCTGIQIVSSGDLKVIDDRNNIGLTALLSTPYSYEIASGSISPKGEKNIRVATEGAAASDDLDTIVGTNYGPDEFLTLIANTDAKTVVCKDGTGNLRLSGDFSLDNDEDRITLSYNGTNWCEISRSANSP